MTIYWHQCSNRYINPILNEEKKQEINEHINITTEYIEDTVALLINEGIMELKPHTGFYSRHHWTLTYEEVTEKKEKELILGTWV